MVSSYDQCTGNQLGTIPKKKKKNTDQLTTVCIENLVEKYAKAIL